MKAKTFVLWVLRVVLAAQFIPSGWMKLSSHPMMVGLFEQVGLGQWFRYFTGALEIAGAIALLIPAVTWIGALAEATVMVGAIGTHLFIVGGSFAVPLVLLALSLTVAALTAPEGLFARRRVRSIIVTGIR